MITSTSMLAPHNVEALIMDCVYDKSEDASGHITVDGITEEYWFNPARIELYRQEIQTMLSELPDGITVADGRAILTSVVQLDRHGKQWASNQQQAEWLIMLGIATGMVTYFAPLEGSDSSSFIYVKQ